MPMKIRLIQSTLMSLLLCILMTGWVTWLNLGLSSQFMGLWGRAFALAWPAAFLISFTLGPLVARLSHRLAQPRQKAVQD